MNWNGYKEFGSYIKVRQSRGRGECHSGRRWEESTDKDTSSDIRRQIWKMV